MLLLKKHLVLLVRQGKKRQTIRLWSKPLLRVGQVSYTPGLGKMLITAVDQLASLEALTERDARDDGFESLAGLLAEIRKIYGPSAKGRAIYRIRFDWPIDAAGKSLAIAPSEDSQKRPSSAPRSSALRKAIFSTGGRMRAMSAQQRQILRKHILENRPM